MDVVLYDIMYDNPFSILTAIVTGCSVSHGSLVVNGVNYDTTLTRGTFDKATRLIDYPEQMVTVFKLDVDTQRAQALIDELIGTKYDRLGLFLWPLNIHNKDKLYCFEAQAEVLRGLGFAIPKGVPISGRTIYTALINAGYHGIETRASRILPN